jgi:5-formyltetrahydrofolate cyclo-ligase
MSAPTNASDKTHLRQHYRRMRRALHPSEQALAASAVARQLPALPGWNEVNCIGLYLAADGELDPTEIARLCRDTGRQVLLPRLRGEALEFAHWEIDDTLVANRFRIPEPPPHRPAIPLEAIDLLCLPLVAYDRRGTRLGMGGGFYDRTLAQRPPQLGLLGLAHRCQEAQELPRQDWDQPLQWVANDEGVIDCGSSPLLRDDDTGL